MRMRTRDQCIALLKQDDPETAITRSSLEYLITSGKIARVEIGNKILINYDLLLEVLAKGFDEPQEAAAPGTIRPVKV